MSLQKAVGLLDPPSSLESESHLLPERRRLEFQAVILAGGDSATLYPLLDEKQCLALLPVANRPLLYYQLRLLEKAGFAEVIVAVEEQFRKQVNDFLGREKFKIKVELFHPKLGDDDWESALVVKQLSSMIFTDFLVLSGDLVTEASIHALADVHRTRDAAATILLRENEPVDWKELTSKPATFSWAAVQAEEVKTFFGLQQSGPHMNDYRVVMTRASEGDSGCMLGRNLLDRCPRFVLHTNLSDSHLYIFKRWMLDVIEVNNFASLKDDLLPYLVSMQWRKDFPTKYPDIWEKAKSSQSLAHSMSSAAWIAPQDEDRIRVYSYVAPYKKGGSVFTARANSLEQFCWMSFALIEHPVGEMTPWDAFVSAQAVTQIPDEQSEAGSLRSTSEKGLKLVKTLLGTGCTIHPSANLTKCIIGENCFIGPRVRMRNCLLLSNCRIEEASQLENSLVGSGVIVQKESIINKCQIGPRYVVIGGTNVENTMLVHGEDDDSDDDAGF